MPQQQSLVTRAITGLLSKSYPLGDPSAGRATSGTGTGAGSVSLTGSRTVSYAALYQHQPWVYIVTNKFARSFARLPLWAYAGIQGGGTASERLTAGSLYELMEEPAPLMAPFSWKEAIAGNLCIYGNAMLVKDRQGARTGAPRALWPSNFSRWSVVPGVDTPIAMYLYQRNDGSKIPFLPEEVVHLRWWNSGSEILGLSPMEPLRRTLAAEDAMQRLQVATFENGLRPSGVLTTPNVFDGTKPADKLALQRLRENVERLHGGPDRAFRLAILEGGMDWKPMAHDFTDAAMVPLRKLTREEVAAAIDIPPPMVGILDNATFANIDTQHRMLYQDSMGPPTTMVGQNLQVQLVRRETEWRGQFLEFNMDDVLRGSLLEELRAFQLAQWFMTPNEVRANRNLGKLSDPEADRIHVPLSTTTEVSDLGNQPEKQAALKAHLDHLEQAALSRVGAGMPLPDLEQWATRALEIGGEDCPEVWGPLLTELASAQSTDEVRTLLSNMRGMLPTG